MGQSPNLWGTNVDILVWSDMGDMSPATGERLALCSHWATLKPHWCHHSSLTACRAHARQKSLHGSHRTSRGAWVAQSVQWPTLGLGSGHNLSVVGSSPMSHSALWLYLSLPLPLLTSSKIRPDQLLTEDVRKSSFGKCVRKPSTYIISLNGRLFSDDNQGHKTICFPQYPYCHLEWPALSTSDIQCSSYTLQ